MNTLLILLSSLPAMQTAFFFLFPVSMPVNQDLNFLFNHLEERGSYIN